MRLSGHKFLPQGFKSCSQVSYTEPLLSLSLGRIVVDLRLRLGGANLEPIFDQRVRARARSKSFQNHPRRGNRSKIVFFCHIPFVLMETSPRYLQDLPTKDRPSLGSGSKAQAKFSRLAIKRLRA